MTIPQVSPFLQAKKKKEQKTTTKKKHMLYTLKEKDIKWFVQDEMSTWIFEILKIKHKSLNKFIIVPWVISKDRSIHSSFIKNTSVKICDKN